MSVEEHLDAGREALAGGRWKEAISAFQSSLSEGETPEALDGIGAAFWWLCDARSSVRYRERAYKKFRDAGDPSSAGRTAVNLSIAYLFNLANETASRGWLARAERLLGGSDPNPMQGWLWDVRSFLTPDREHARDLLMRALECARDSGDFDLELVTLADLGLALAVDGDSEQALPMLDEAMAGTLGGEYSRLETVVFTGCSMLSAFSLLGDLERASQCAAMADDFMRDYSSPFLFAHCRVHYGSVLVVKGHWNRAEGELLAALNMSTDARPHLKAEAASCLADLRLRQGRLEEAAALLAAVDDVAVATLPAAAFRLARGEPAVALAIVERRLKQLDEGHVEASPTLAMLVETHLARGDVGAAIDAATRLSTLAQVHRRPHAAALAEWAIAHVGFAEGRVDESISGLEAALEMFSRLDLPLETGRVRLELATALAGDNPEFAAAEARIAMTVFERLGASVDADAAASLLRSLGVHARTGAKNAGVLTNREQEVLRLVCLGLTNPEIAERLFISRKTAAHHVSSLLSKLGLRNRAEAVAYGTRAGLTPLGR